MKAKVFLWLAAALFSCSFQILGQVPEKRIHLPVRSVTVFADRAQVTLSGKVGVPSGKSELILTDIPVRMLEGTLQCSATGKVSILSISVASDPEKGKEENKKLEARAAQLRDSIDLQKIRIAVLDNEKELLQGNRKAGGDGGVKAAELKELADFMSSRLTALSTERHNIEKAIGQMEIRYKEVSEELSRARKQQSRTGNSIRILAESPSPVSSALTVSYIASGAEWTPVYDIRLPEEGGEAMLNYKARVRQFTGTDWENVSLVLSSGNPASVRQVPVIYPYYLRNEPLVSHSVQNNVLNMASPRSLSASGAAVSNTLASVTKDVLQEEKRYGSPVIEEEEGADAGMLILSDPSRSMNNVDYAIKIPYTIPSDDRGAGSLVQVAQYPLEVKYEYIVTPRVSQEALLVAGIPNYSSYNLLDGEATLYLGNSYRGAQFIDRSAVSPLNDILNLSMGPDKDIVVKRVSKQNFRKATGSTVKVQRLFETTIRNNKNVPVKIKVEDQYPLSQDDKIKVEDLVYTPANAKAEQTTGKLTWEITLQPKESVAIELGYTVRHPEDWNVVVR